MIRCFLFNALYIFYDSSRCFVLFTNRKLGALFYLAPPKNDLFCKCAQRVYESNPVGKDLWSGNDNEAGECPNPAVQIGCVYSAASHRAQCHPLGLPSNS